MLTVLLGSVLKFDGRFILQTKTDGPVRMLVVDYTTPDKVRALATFDKERIDAAIAEGKVDAGTLLGHGHLAMTVDQGTDASRYQGLVALEGKDLEHAAHEYFLRSEQIPTRMRLRSVRNCPPAPTAPAIAGGPAACCCNSCRNRRSGRACLISIPVTRPKGSRRICRSRTMPGWKAVRWWRRSRTSN